MAETFSESWHRVGTRRLRLRPSVRSRRQLFRGERWFVLHDPFNNQYFRVRPEAYEFLARLDGLRTVDAIWEECLATNPEGAPGQEDVVRLLAQLYQANLTAGDVPPEAARVFERYRKRRRQQFQSRLMSVLFLRLPLFDPDAWLQRMLPFVSWFFSPWGACLWLAAAVPAVMLVLGRTQELSDQTQSVLSPSNLPLLYLSLIGLKLLHEFGHAFSCRRYGGEVHTLGVMMLVFTPMPYVDATSSWGFPSRWQRMAVALAGMWVELFVAFLATCVWALTGPGVIHALAYNVMFIASVSTLLANANPLLRFDGYYILSDLLDMPNLYQRAARWWKYFAERWLFGMRRAVNPAASRREAAFLAVYGALSFIYRAILFGGIILFVAGRFLLLGLTMALAGLITWLVIPIGKLVRYLAESPHLIRSRRRAILVTASLVAAPIILLGVVPFPHWFSVPGVLQSEGYELIFSGAPGVLVETVAVSGDRVEKGAVLVRLENPEMDIQWRAALAEEAEALAVERQALQAGGEGHLAASERVLAVQQRKEHLAALRAALEIRAPSAGVWISPNIGQLGGRWLPRGAVIGELVDPERVRFSGVVTQDDASFLFHERIRATGVRLRGDADRRIGVRVAAILQAEKRRLPSAGLGFMGGGDIAVRSDDQEGTTATESFFELRAELEPAADVALLHGRSGKLRCWLPPEPLLSQWTRKFRQVLQKRLGF